MLRINFEYRKGILFCRLKGNLNKNTTDKFREYTIPIIKDYGIKYLVYNLEGLNEIDSIGENALMDTSSVIRENEGRVLLVNNRINTTIKLDKIANELLALDLIKI